MIELIKFVVSLLGGVRATIFALLLAAASVFGWAQTHRLASANKTYADHLASDAKADLLAKLKARTDEYEKAVAIGKAGEAYDQGKHDAQAAADSDIAALRAGTLRLQNRWAGCVAEHMPEAPGPPGVTDGAAELRFQGASDLVRNADTCDAQVAGLQAALRAEREPLKTQELK